MCIFVQHSKCLLDTGEHWLLEKDKINHSGEGEKEKKMIKKKTVNMKGKSDLKEQV